MGGSCLRYYAYRNMVAVKMVFVTFWGDKEPILEEAARLPWLRAVYHCVFGGPGYFCQNCLESTSVYRSKILQYLKACIGWRLILNDRPSSVYQHCHAALSREL